MLPSPRPVAWTYEQVPIAVVVDAIRHDIDGEKIAALVASVQGGGKLPAIFVMIDGGQMTILDGHHRAAALAQLGAPTVPCLVARPK